MSFLAIKTNISPERIQNAGQPRSEYIKAETLIQGISGLKYSLAETVRFNDYLRQGGESIRYYHMLDFPDRGLALAVAQSGKSRLVSGLYENRLIVFDPPHEAIIISGHFSGSSIQKTLQSRPITNVVAHSNKSTKLVYTVNCIEFFNAKVVISGSARIPLLAFEGNPEAIQFADLINDHILDCKSKFTPVHVATADVTLETVINIKDDEPSLSCNMIINGKAVVTIPLPNGCQLF